MKEILFRGKRVGDGKWVYGSLILAGKYCCILEAEENVHPMDYPYLDPDLGIIDGQATPVIPETVGRLIEHPDYDGRYDEQRFFEGDILEVKRYRWSPDDAKPDTIAIIVNESCITENGLTRWFPQDTTAVRIVGNIHDNPELVGKEYAEMYKSYFGFER